MKKLDVIILASVVIILGAFIAYAQYEPDVAGAVLLIGAEFAVTMLTLLAVAFFISKNQRASERQVAKHRL